MAPQHIPSMRILPLAAALALVVALLVPAAGALPQPTFYFLKTGCPVPEVEGQCVAVDVTVPALPPLPPPLPGVPTVGQPQVVLADGVLAPYDFLNPNPPNSTEPDVKPVYPLSSSTVPVRFVAPADAPHPDRIKGPFLVGLWVGESPALNANLTTTLYELKADGSKIALANASVAIDLNASKAPNPTNLVPPNSTDPMAIAYYELAQVLPVVLQPPLLFLLGPVDIAFDNTSMFAMEFHLDPGSSPGPLPLGASTIRFNATLMPSFLYVPWYAPDPPRSTNTKTPTSSFSSSGSKGSSSSGSSSSDPGDGGGKGIPGLEVSLVISLVALAAVVARRRLE